MFPTPVHVWVDPTNRWTSPSPGLLLYWRKKSQGRWEAWCISVSTYPTGQNGPELQVTQAWHDAAHVRKA